MIADYVIDIVYKLHASSKAFADSSLHRARRAFSFAAAGPRARDLTVLPRPRPCRARLDTSRIGCQSFSDNRGTRVYRLARVVGERRRRFRTTCRIFNAIEKSKSPRPPPLARGIIAQSGYGGRRNIAQNVRENSRTRRRHSQPLAVRDERVSRRYFARSTWLTCVTLSDIFRRRAWDNCVGSGTSGKFDGGVVRARNLVAVARVFHRCIFQFRGIEVNDKLNKLTVTLHSSPRCVSSLVESLFFLAEDRENYISRTILLASTIIFRSIIVEVLLIPERSCRIISSY